MNIYVAEQFAELFRGRTDAYGTEEGGCEWVENCPRATDNDFLARLHVHLTTGPCMGVYPLVSDPEWGPIVRWGCVDFDDGDEVSLIHAHNLAAALAHFRVDGWLERSRSKGYHVWVFVDQWVPAQLMREALMGACQVADAPLKEVNPKQVKLAEGQVGNYVRLPYPGNGAPGRQVIMHDYSVVDPLPIPTAGAFVDLALQRRATPGQLEQLAELYEPPPPPQRIIKPFVDDGRTAVQRLSGLAYTIFMDGPLDGSDRSDTLWKLSCLLREEGSLTYQEALALLEDADRRWGKFSERYNGQQQLAKMLSKAWG